MMSRGANGEAFAAAVASALNQGLEFEGQIIAAGAQIRELSKQAYGTPLLDGRLTLMATCAKLLYAYNGQPGKTNPSVHDRLTLIAAFLQGVPATESLISEGQYVKAAAALKQDMEVLARIHETMAGAAKAGSTPQMKHLPAEGARRFYGELNKVAHPSNSDLLEQLLAHGEPGPGAVGISAIPAFVDATAVGLYELHVYFLFEMTRELIRLFTEMYDQEDVPLQQAVKLWMGVSLNLESAGHFQPVE